MRFGSAFLLLLTIFQSGYSQIPGLAPEKNYDLNGYVKYMGSINVPKNLDNSYDHLIHQRFNYEYRFTNNFHFNAGMRNRLLAGDSAKLEDFSDLIDTDHGYMDLTFNWLEEESMVGNTQFDRLYLDWSNDNWQARIGRSRINWAITTLWNPNDIFNSYSIYDFDYEERAGSDSALLKYKLGFASSIEAVYNPDQDSDFTSYAMRYLLNSASWDIQVLAGKSELDYVFGVGFAGDIKGAGLRGEITHFNPAQDYLENGGENIKLKSSIVATVESDYSFSGNQNWTGRLAVLYISNPQDQESALEFLYLPLTARTLSFTQTTFYADVGFDVNALNRLTLSTSYYDDGSFFAGSSNSYSLANDWQLLTVLQSFGGTDTSLFGKTPGLFAFVQVRWSF